MNLRGPAKAGTAQEAIVDAFNQHPDQAFRARELHELLDTHRRGIRQHHPQPPRTPHPKASLPNPDETAIRNGLNAHSVFG
ncbi:hypothetical protein ABID94_003247 [Streptomyces sp. PvR018]